MPSAFTHAAAATAISAWFYRRDIPKSVWVAGALAAIAPDLDAIGFWAGVPYDSLFGHRGITHSLFAAALGAMLLTAAFRHKAGASMPAARLAAYFFLVIASHGFLDAFTDGGGGIAFFSPFITHRWFFPFRPIRVAPISITRFFTHRGLLVFSSELLWVWIPAAIATLLAFFMRGESLGTGAGSTSE